MTREDLLRKAAPLRGLADAVNVTDGAGARAHMGALAAAAILDRAGIEPILQITCRDKNRIALQSELMGAAALGIRNLMLLDGDDPKAGDQPETKAVFDIDSKTLIETARRLRDDGTLPTGRKVAGRRRFLIGAADIPLDPPAGWQPAARRQSLSRRAVRADPILHGCGDRAPLRRGTGGGRPHAATRPSVGVNPLRSAKSARWMKDRLFGTIIPDALIARMEKAADPVARGRAHLRRADRGALDHSRRRRRPHHGAGKRRGHSGNDRGGAGEGEKRDSLKLRATDANTKKGRPRGQPFHCQAVARLRRRSAALRA